MNGLYAKIYMMTDHTPSDVPNFKRFVAFAVDWFVGYLCFAAPIAFIWKNQVPGSDDLVTNINVLATKLGPMYGYIAVALALLIAIIYYVVLPWRMNGQTPGKRLMGIKIVKVNDEPVDLKTLIMRQVVGIMIVEGYVYSISEMMRQLMGIADLKYMYIFFSAAAVVLTGLSIFISVKFDSHRMLHDYIAKTKVVDAENADKK